MTYAVSRKKQPSASAKNVISRCADNAKRNWKRKTSEERYQFIYFSSVDVFE